MSSPIPHGKNCDPVLIYAPRWAREQTSDADEPPRRRVEQPQEDWPTFTGDRAALELQRQLALDPITVPEPPLFSSSEQSAKPLLLRACGLVVVAAVVAAAIVLIFGAKPHGGRMGHVSAAALVTSSAPVKQDQLHTAAMTRAEWTDPGAGHDRTSANAPADRSAAATDHHAAPAAPQRDAANASSTEAAASTTHTRTPPVAIQEPPANRIALRQLDHDEIASLEKRGEDFIVSGDIAAARLVLRRAAEAGDAHAALTLAGTFDPILLEKLGRPELADAAMALAWYTRAAQYGSPEAPRQLQQLANQVNLSPEQQR